MNLRPRRAAFSTRRAKAASERNLNLLFIHENYHTQSWVPAHRHETRIEKGARNILGGQVERSRSARKRESHSPAELAVPEIARHRSDSIERFQFLRPRPRHMRSRWRSA